MKDRIKSLRRVKASLLVPNARNWRTHPDAQRSALRSMLGDVGLVAAAIARELPGGRLELLDGHLRAEEAGDEKIPVLIVDLTDEEAAKVLATFDPLSQLAGRDNELLGSLLADAALSGELQERLFADMKRTEKALIEMAEERAGEPDPKQAPTHAPAEKFPLAVVLTAQQLRQWKAWKDDREILSDTDGFLALLGEESDA